MGREIQSNACREKPKLDPAVIDIVEASNLGRTNSVLKILDQRFKSNLMSSFAVESTVEVKLSTVRARMLSFRKVGEVTTLEYSYLTTFKQRTDTCA